MENNKLPDNLIDDFIMGLLTKEEVLSISNRIQQDDEFKKEVELRKEMIYGIDAYGRKSFKQELKDIHVEVIDQAITPAKRRSLLPYLAVAASVMVLVVALFWLMNKDKDLSNQELYAANFEAYDISDRQRSVNNEDLIRLETLYNNKKYAEAIPLFESVLSNTNSNSSYLLLAMGISNLELEKPEIALSYFKQITENGDFNFEDEVRWYSALAYLKLDDVKSTKEYLQPLVEDDSADHHGAAVELLKALE